MWKDLVTWLKSKNITSHSVAGAVVAFAVAYNSSEQFRKVIGDIFVGYPVVITKLGIAVTDIVAIAALWAKYSHSSAPVKPAPPDNNP